MKHAHDDLFEHLGDTRKIPPFMVSYFDHLHSQFLRWGPRAGRPGGASEVAELRKKRETDVLRWEDVYALDLILLDVLPDEDLVRKAFDMRAKYRSIAGQRDYDAYVASKPPDLATIQLGNDSAEKSSALVASQVLRADIRYLLNQFCLHDTLAKFQGVRGHNRRL